MTALIAIGWVVSVLVFLVLLQLAMSVRVVKQYEDGVLFRLGRVDGNANRAFGSSCRSSMCRIGIRCGS